MSGYERQHHCIAVLLLIALKSTCIEPKILLHVHHKSGLKTDNKDSNLMVLCELCHSEQLQHSLTKVQAHERKKFSRNTDEELK